MKIGVVTDSTADLPVQLVEQHEIEVVPCMLIIDGHEYADGEGISRPEFYLRMAQSRETPTTAAPSIGEFRKRYQRLIDGGCERVISVHAAAALTSMVSTAQQAAQEFNGRVSVVDSRSLSLGLGFQALAAAEQSANGTEAALEAVEATRRRLRLFAALDTFEYARRSGRVPPTLSVFGGLLHIKPLIELADGEIKAIGAARTTRQADLRMKELFREVGTSERLAILHSGIESRAREFLKAIMQEHSQSLPRDILMVNVTPVIGTHVGPNAVGFAVIGA
jgi:fatty acid kinase fatty acid binding subunit